MIKIALGFIVADPSVSIYCILYNYNTIRDGCLVYFTAFDIHLTLYVPYDNFKKGGYFYAIKLFFNSLLFSILSALGR